MFCRRQINLVFFGIESSSRKLLRQWIHLPPFRPSVRRLESIHFLIWLGILTERDYENRLLVCHYSKQKPNSILTSFIKDVSTSTWDRHLPRMVDVPWGYAWRLMFHKLSRGRVFDLSVRHRELNDFVHQFLMELTPTVSHKPQEYSMWTLTTVFVLTYAVIVLIGIMQHRFIAYMPFEMLSAMMEYMNVEDLLRLGHTSRLFRYITNDFVTSRSHRLFDSLHLDIGRVRYMLQHTGSVISGSVALLALFPGTRAGIDFVPGDVDFYVPSSHKSAVLNFFVNTTSYRSVTTDDTSYNPSGGIQEVLLLHDGVSRSVNIIVAIGDNALVPIIQFHSTFLMNWISHGGLTCTYRKMTFNQTGVIRAKYFPLDDPADRDNSKRVLEKYILRSMNVVVDPSKVPHLCAVDSCCSDTVRSTVDRDCIFFPFEEHTPGVVVKTVHNYDGINGVAWARGGISCRGSRMAHLPAFVTPLETQRGRSTAGINLLSLAFHSNPFVFRLALAPTCEFGIGGNRG